MSILMVGSVALDTVETPFGEAKEALGGSATHAGIAASKLAEVDIVGVVGDDFPKRHINMLKKHNIGLDGLEIVEGGETFRWGGRYHDNINQRDTLFTELGVFESFRPNIGGDLAKKPYVFLANIDPELQLQVLEQSRKPKLTMLDTMNLWIDIRRDELVKAMKKVDVVLMNDEEAMMFANTTSLEQAARDILKLGCKRVLIKKGEHGCLMFSNSGFFAAPAIPLKKVKDPTGAGDTFAGGLIGYLAKVGRLNEDAFRQAVVVGTAMASFCVEDFSVKRVSRLKPEDLRERVRMIADAIKCKPIRSL